MFLQLEGRGTGVDTFNGIFAFGDEISKIQEFTDKTSASKAKLSKTKTTVGNKTVLDALEEIIDEFDDIE